ncbi:MAG: hypothetical protein IJG48_01940 [Mogibacterium sp.]|nr:hypothetical protein [Mogibacterium sp.]
MKFILELILVVLGLSIGFLFFPALIGVFIGLTKYDDGNTLGGIIAITIGLVVQGLMFLFIYLDSGSGSGSSHDEDGECPYCGSGDTDGNHCYTCDDDF